MTGKVLWYEPDGGAWSGPIFVLTHPGRQS